MRRWIVGVLVLALVAPASAQAKLLASSSDIGTWPVPDVYGSISRPQSMFFRVTMDPSLPAHGKARISCDKGIREASREFAWSESASFERAIPIPFRKADYCSAGVDFYYEEDFEASVQLDLYATARKKKHTRP